MEATLDGISSALVMWRFKTGKKRNFTDAEAAALAKEARDARRERNSSVGIGATFVASSCMLSFSAAGRPKCSRSLTPSKGLAYVKS
ncbi:unnamed protein product [Effrenium voratum]|nr:unnamed protein product [Effrenium voratum]